ncbi:MAG: acetyltransferase [Methanomethylovorans sp. PtaU1.Bin093]|uniref:GNAT family N-acetyltransferase n=1 Tax=Methanomethylovorans sp. PtaU1.Bin093 TaxID=1811679 RepID=UPI0009C940A3|nr:GNAT family N-acetyltransferase [Methanomethylovorans sp. PtaU1.Bin093]OPY18673.1 MAG: acetyltransferase [Methanomethylovorans sp. PtaU1.Bin093]
MIIKVFSPLLNSSVKKFVVSVLASEGFAYDMEKDLDLDDISANYLEDGGIFYVAFTEGRIIGTCAVKKRSEEKCEVKRLYVHKDLRRLGIGSELLGKALEFAREHYNTAILKTSTSQKQAIALYLKTGFFVQKEEKGVIYFTMDLAEQFTL